jgi:hypothetical protein
MYGRVQSGKTAAMILTSALCLDNGFKVVIVLTANTVALVRQTTARFRSLDGPRVFSTDKDDAYEWEGQEDEIAEDIAAGGLVLVCAKDANHFPNVIRFLQRVGAPGYPAIVLDDEADAATPDTTIAARTSGRANAPAHASTINRRVIENTRPGEEGESIGEMFTHKLYAQVTATPFILFLQRSTSNIRPTRTFLLEAGAGYCGGETFFGAFDATDNVAPDAPIVVVSPTEAQAINLRPVPGGLRASIEYFLLASCAAAGRDGRWPTEGFKHLSHSSPRVDQHTVLSTHIERHLSEIRRELRANRAASEQRFAAALTELRRTYPVAAGLDMLLRALPEVINQAQVIRINSDSDLRAYGPRVNFLVGGNILGRGLTIDDLLVTYYVREAQVSQMDTVWQHARMYGYRTSLLPFTRVYLPRRLAGRFREIHEAEEHLRDLLRREHLGETVPVRIARGTRATRPNATEPASLAVIRAGQQQLHPVAPAVDLAVAQSVLDILRTEQVPITRDRNQRVTAIAVAQALRIVDLIPIPAGDDGDWNSDTIAALIESHADELNGQINVYVRELQADASPSRTRGRLSGPEITMIRQASGRVPAMALLYSGDPNAPQSWYPTLVMPADSATYIVNPN